MTKAINRVAPSRRLGGWGEDAAAEHLMGLGWQVVARNWRGEGGEVDLIALEPVDDGPPIGVIVEVSAEAGSASATHWSRSRGPSAHACVGLPDNGG